MYAAFMAVGWLASRRVRDRTPADLIVAGRAMPLWVAALTMTATWVDGGYLLGTTEGAKILDSARDPRRPLLLASA